MSIANRSSSSPSWSSSPSSTGRPPPLLELEGLGFRYGRGSSAFRALDDVSLTVAAGQTLGVVGESGSGKSTLARLVMRMLPPTEGAVRFWGRDLDMLRGRALQRHRTRVQMVFQDPNDSLDPRFTVRRSVAEPLAAAGVGRVEREERVARVLADVGFEPDAMTRLPHEFSGGQRQRIAIARAMVTQPDLIVLDEPTSALDVSIQAQILNLLLDLQERTGVAYVFISHNLAVVRHLSHSIAVMNHGRVVEHGDAETVFASPRDEYARELLTAMPTLYRS